MANGEQARADGHDREIETLEEFDRTVARGTLSGYRLQSVDLASLEVVDYRSTKTFAYSDLAVGSDPERH